MRGAHNAATIPQPAHCTIVIAVFTQETAALLHKNMPALPLLACEPSLRHDMDDLVAQALPCRRLLVVQDERTREAMGERVVRALSGRFEVASLILPGEVEADDITVALLESHVRGAEALVAVGGGTLNDLCKYAAHRLDIPYLVFPAAASMNGYLSANASIRVGGFKTTLPARMPLAVLCDLSVIADAPPRLSRAGLGDCLARPTAQADWLLSHLLLKTPYDDIPFALLNGLEDEMLEAARGIGRNDVPAIRLLMQVLLLSGLGMTIAKGSYPASQGEHMIAHAHGMFIGHSAALHGEEIALTAPFMAARQEALLRAAPRVLPLDVPSLALSGQPLKGARDAFFRKCEAIEQAGLDNASLAARWPQVAQRIAPVLLSPQRLKTVLEAAGAPQHPTQIGWTPESFSEACGKARFTRERFTFLDIG